MGGVGARGRVTALPPTRQPTRAWGRRRQEAGDAVGAVSKGGSKVSVSTVVGLLQSTILQREVSAGRGAATASTGITSTP